jgi:predicted RNA binding protein YcfA (HicA-like mRNA interferase family)
MPKLRQFSGQEVVEIFLQYGFVIKRQVGSHVRLTLEKENNSFHITIPLHRSLKKGTLSHIVKDFEICFGREETDKIFR